MNITEKNIVNIVSKIIKEELDPEFAAKQKKYEQLIIGAIDRNAIDDLLKQATESFYQDKKHVKEDEDGVHWVNPTLDDIEEILMDSLEGIYGHLLEVLYVPEEDRGAFEEALYAVVAKYLRTSEGVKELGYAIEDAKESAQDSAYIEKHGMDAYYGVKGMFGPK